MAPWLIYCHTIIYGKKVTSCKKFRHNLTLEVEIVWRVLVIQCYSEKYENAEKYLNFQKLNFTRLNERASVRELFWDFLPENLKLIDKLRL